MIDFFKEKFFKKKSFTKSCESCELFKSSLEDSIGSVMECRDKNFGFCEKIKGYYEPTSKNKQICIDFKERKNK